MIKKTNEVHQLKKKNLIYVLDRKDIYIWLVSAILITFSFLISGNDYLNLATSLIGVTALMYLSKGEPFGQILSIVFSLGYAFVAYNFKYYGEMITYVFMTLPSALFATYIWLKNPLNVGVSQIKIGKMSKGKLLLIFLTAPIVTLIFFFILRAFKTPNLLISTISITTSFIASMFTFYRSKYYAVAYAFNDIVLIILWVLATIESLSYLPMVLCFLVFLFNDLNAFFSWSKMEDKQKLHH